VYIIVGEDGVTDLRRPLKNLKELLVALSDQVADLRTEVATNAALVAEHAVAQDQALARVEAKLAELGEHPELTDLVSGLRGNNETLRTSVTELHALVATPLPDEPPDAPTPDPLPEPEPEPEPVPPVDEAPVDEPPVDDTAPVEPTPEEPAPVDQPADEPPVVGDFS